MIKKELMGELSELKEMIVNNKKGDISNLLENPILENIIEKLYSKTDTEYEVISKKDFHDKKVDIQATQRLMDLITKMNLEKGVEL